MAQVSTGSLGHIYTDIDQTIVEIDDVFVGMLGRERHEMVGRHALFFTYDRDLVVNKPLLDALSRTGPAFAITKRYVRGDGSLIWVDNHVSTVRTGVGDTLLCATSRVRDRPFGSEDLSRNYRRARQICAAFMSARVGPAAGLFSAPAVEALLWLYRAEIEGRAVSVEELAAHADCSIAAMLRWVMLLRLRGLIEVEGNQPIARTTTVRITRICERRLDGLLAQLGG